MVYKIRMLDNAFPGDSYKKKSWGVWIYTITRDHYTTIPEPLAKEVMKRESDKYEVIDDDPVSNESKNVGIEHIEKVGSVSVEKPREVPVSFPKKIINKIIKRKK